MSVSTRCLSVSLSRCRSANHAFPQVKLPSVNLSHERWIGSSSASVWVDSQMWLKSRVIAEREPLCSLLHANFRANFQACLRYVGAMPGSYFVE